MKPTPCKWPWEVTSVYKKYAPQDVVTLGRTTDWFFHLLHSRWHLTVRIVCCGALLQQRHVAALFKWDVVFRRVLKISKGDYSLRVCLAARQHGTTRLPTGRIFMKVDMWGLFENLPRKFKFQWNLAKVTDTWHEDLCTFIMICRLILLRMTNVSDKFLEKIKTHVLCSVSVFWKSCRLWDSVEKYYRPGQSTDDIRRMRFACWITKATNTDWKYIIFTVFFDR